jgi:hypothetical protein
MELEDGDMSVGSSPCSFSFEMGASYSSCSLLLRLVGRGTSRVITRRLGWGKSEFY